MVTQANAQETTNALPPAARDFEAYRLVKVERKSTREAAKLLRISQTRVCQVVARVAEYMVDVTEPASDERLRLGPVELLTSGALDPPHSLLAVLGVTRKRLAAATPEDLCRACELEPCGFRRARFAGAAIEATA